MSALGSRAAGRAALVALVLLGEAARAQSPDAKERARALLEEGSAALERGDAGRALSRFDEAFRVFPSPRIHFNRGLALRALGRHAEALESLRTFISEAADAAERPRAQAREMLAELERKVGWLEIECDTDAVDLLVDGRRAAGGAAGKPVPLDAGTRRLRLLRAGAGPEARPVEVSRTIAAGERATLACGPPSSTPGPAASHARPAPAPEPAPLAPSGPPPDARAAPAAALADRPAPATPVTSRPWFWVAAAAVVAGGVAAAIWLRRPADPPRGSLGAQDLR
jgi:hypothetical protein